MGQERSRGLLTPAKDARDTVLAHVYDGLDRQIELREESVTGTPRMKWTYDTVSGAKGLLAEAKRYADGAEYTTKITQYDRLYRPARTEVVVPEREGGRAGTYHTGTSYLPSDLVRGVSYSAAGALPGGGYSYTAIRHTPLGGGHQAVKSDDGSITFTLADHQGTGQLAVDAAEQGLTQRRTLPFGGVRGTAPTAWAGGKGFVGGTDDTSDTGLTHLGAREYDPATGRFLSVDPVMDLTDPQQLNGYA